MHGWPCARMDGGKRRTRTACADAMPPGRKPLPLAVISEPLSLFESYAESARVAGEEAKASVTSCPSGYPTDLLPKALQVSPFSAVQPSPSKLIISLSTFVFPCRQPSIGPIQRPVLLFFPHPRLASQSTAAPGMQIAWLLELDSK